MLNKVFLFALVASILVVLNNGQYIYAPYAAIPAVYPTPYFAYYGSNKGPGQEAVMADDPMKPNEFLPNPLEPTRPINSAPPAIPPMVKPTEEHVSNTQSPSS
ncbi:hypothetical protein M3Y95_00255600 [Aphelenchoides besseyi]|nr:hypothetical protein M3Y95_00255600 [Aphelenchoides besseyi]